MGGISVVVRIDREWDSLTTCRTSSKISPNYIVYSILSEGASDFAFFSYYQIMAIGTLALCYNNIEVFRGVVKMRRGKMNILDSLLLTQSELCIFTDRMGL